MGRVWVGLVESAAEHAVRPEVDAEHQEQLLNEQQAGAGDEITPAQGEEDSAEGSSDQNPKSEGES